MSNDGTLQFLGGADTVTGSKTLVETQNSRILVDCGLFQGIKRRRERNWKSLPVDVESIGHVVLTHGHLDHVGYLPRLVKEGFDGTIHATAPTAEVAQVILMDSAKIQEEDARHANEKGYTKHDPAKPLYTIEDAKDALDKFVRHEANRWIDVTRDIACRFRPNGHILGSTFLELDVGDRRLVFSGDLGRSGSVLHEPPEIPDPMDLLVLESTYGDRLHLQDDPAKQLEKIVQHTSEKGGNLIIPSFTLGRAQELMYLLQQLRDQNRIGEHPVYLDSPMGVNITELYNKYTNWHKLDRQGCKKINRNVEMIRSFDRTRTVLEESGTKIILAGSGMLTGGRVLFYLKKLISDPATTILMTGYQAEGTRGRRLQEGAHEIKFHGEFHSVEAEVRELTNLSAHADQSEILEWLRQFEEPPERVLLNHGEPQASQALRVKLSDELGWSTDTVRTAQTVEIDS
jgi:metallo-beta-lactamase family protein